MKIYFPSQKWRAIFGLFAAIILLTLFKETWANISDSYFKMGLVVIFILSLWTTVVNLYRAFKKSDTD